MKTVQKKTNKQNPLKIQKLANQFSSTHTTHTTKHTLNGDVQFDFEFRLP